jgi:HPt (histidine-containing phosphotransfer) domain-containing protein
MMPGSRPPAFDPEIIASLRERNEADGPGFLKELLDIFLEDAPLKLDDFDAAIRCGNADWLMRSAHDLGGSAGNVGAARLSALCRQVELQARSGRLEGIEAGVMRIRDEYDAVFAEAALLLRPARR